MNSRNRNFQNRARGGDVVFVTTTCLDFVPLLRSEFREKRVIHDLIQAHSKYEAGLHAFVIMPDHVHWIARLPEDRDVSFIVNRFKSLSGYWIARDLSLEESSALSARSGLNRRGVWERSFRSVICNSLAVIQQKVAYIHMNPVRRKLVGVPEVYPWSSALTHLDAQWTDEFAVPFSVEMFQ